MAQAGQPFEPPMEGSLPVGASREARDRSPDQPAAFCGSRSKPPRRGPARPMLFAQKVLAPGPQPKHPGTVNPPQADPRQSRGFTQMKLIHFVYIYTHENQYRFKRSIVS
jgi:hypothetical protein